MAEGALPKGFERPSDSGSQGGSSSSAPKNVEQTKWAFLSQLVLLLLR